MYQPRNEPRTSTAAITTITMLRLWALASSAGLGSGSGTGSFASASAGAATAAGTRAVAPPTTFMGRTVVLSPCPAAAEAADAVDIGVEAMPSLGPSVL